MSADHILLYTQCLGDRLRMRREERGLTQAGIVDWILDSMGVDISVATVQRIENGSQNIAIKYWLYYMAAVGLPPDKIAVTRVDDCLVCYNGANSILVNRHYDAAGEPIRSILLVDRGVISCEWAYERTTRRGFTFVDIVADGHEAPVEEKQEKARDR